MGIFPINNSKDYNLIFANFTMNKSSWTKKYFKKKILRVYSILNGISCEKPKKKNLEEKKMLTHNVWERFLGKRL